MVKSSYVPDQGDIIYFNFSPSVGREQKGLRPGIVISRIFLNQASGLAVVCPITSKQKFYPFEVLIKTDKISGVVLVDQARSVDYVARKFEFIAYAKEEIISEIKAKFLTLVE